MADDEVQRTKKPHNERRAGRKAEKKKAKDPHVQELTAKQRNPKAFTFNSAVKAQRNFRRKQDIETKKQHIPLVDRTPLEPPPIVVAVVGPPKVGKTTVIKCLVREFTRQPTTGIRGPITLVTGKKRRVTFLECNNDINCMIDVAKVADLVLILIDASFGFEMEVFEFLNICQVHGMPRVMGVLTHLDMFRNIKQLRKTKKILKHRFWTEVYAGAKLFYLSGVIHGEYLYNDMKNLARFISVMKFRPLVWRSTHPYILADRLEDITPPELIRQNPKVDRKVSLYGYVRGVPLNKMNMIHIPGCGDFKIHDVSNLPDPCPLPDVQKKRSLIDRERLIYAPFSGVCGIVYDKDAVYLEVKGNHQISETQSENTLVSSIIETQETLDFKMDHSKLQLFSGTAPILSSDVNKKSGTFCEKIVNDSGRIRRKVMFADEFETPNNDITNDGGSNVGESDDESSSESVLNNSNEKSEVPFHKDKSDKKHKDEKKQKPMDTLATAKAKLLSVLGEDEDTDEDELLEEDYDNDQEEENCDESFSAKKFKISDTQNQKQINKYHEIGTEQDREIHGRVADILSKIEISQKERERLYATDNSQEDRKESRKREHKAESHLSNISSDIKFKHADSDDDYKDEYGMQDDDNDYNDRQDGNDDYDMQHNDNDDYHIRDGNDDYDMQDNDDYDIQSDNIDREGNRVKRQGDDESVDSGVSDAGEEEEERDGAEESAVRWKENLAKKAADAFIERQATTQNLWKLVYGDKKSIDTHSEEEYKQDYEDDIGGLFRVVKKKQQHQQEEKDLMNSDDCSKFFVKQVRDWKDSDICEVIRDCFITGKWKDSEDAAELLKLDDASDGELYGDFEDVETGQKYSAKPESGEPNSKQNVTEKEGGPKKLTREELQEKKRKLKEKFDAEYDDKDGGKTYYDELKDLVDSQAQLNKSEFEDLDDGMRVQLEGYRPGMYVRVEFNDVPCELITNFNPTYPIILGGLLSGEENVGFVQVRIKKHRWHRKILKTRDPLIISLGWRRFQTLPIYTKLEDNFRQRMLKYTPDHITCMAHFWGPITPQLTGFLAVQDVASVQPDFRIAATGSVVELNKSTQITKKLKLIGTPYKIYKKTAFIRDMFNSTLEVAKFEGANLRTVSGIRGQIKKAMSKPEGAFRATFEDKLMLSDIVFCRTWYRVEVPKFYNPVTSLMLSINDKKSWSGMKTVGQLKRERGIRCEPALDSLYTKIERTPMVFKPLSIPRALQKQLPYKDKPKTAIQKKKDILSKRIAVVREPYEQEVAKMMKMLKTSYRQKEKKLKDDMNRRITNYNKEMVKEGLKKMKKQKQLRKHVFRIVSKMEKKESKHKR